jgi:hypothetical protein
MQSSLMGQTQRYPCDCLYKAIFWGKLQSDKHIPLAPPVKLFVVHASLKTPKTVTRRSRRFLKTFKTETINAIPGHIALNKVDEWFQDEVRFGRQNTTTRLWAQTGSRPCVQQQQFEYAGRPTPTCLALFFRQPGQQRPLLPRALI